MLSTIPFSKPSISPINSMFLIVANAFCSIVFTFAGIIVVSSPQTNPNAFLFIVWTSFPIFIDSTLKVENAFSPTHVIPSSIVMLFTES